MAQIPHPDGVTCVSCHAVQSVPLLIGNGGAVRGGNPSGAGPSALRARAAPLGAVSRFLVYLRPWAHRAAVSPSVRFRSAEPRPLA